MTDNTTTRTADHWMVFEWEADTGHRFWSAPMKTREEQMAHEHEMSTLGYELSDADCSTQCPSTDHDDEPHWQRWRAEDAARTRVITITWRAFSDPRDPVRCLPEASTTVKIATDIEDDLELCEAFFAATNTYGQLHSELWEALQPLPEGRSHTSLSVIFDRGDFIRIARGADPSTGKTYEVADCGFTEVK